MKYDVIIVGAGPGGIFSAYELTLRKEDARNIVVESLSGGNGGDPA